MTMKNVTKADVLKRVARSMTKSLKAQGHTVSNGAILNALAAADGSINWHVFVKTVQAQCALLGEAALTSVWVGIHDHRHGDDVYAGRSFDDVYAIKRRIALENIDREYPDYKDEEPMTDEEKVTYYWEAASEIGEEWFGITQHDLEPSAVPSPSAKARGTAEIANLIVASTSHVTRQEAEYLDANGYSRGEYGWFLHVAKGDQPVAGIEHPSPGLAGVIEAAREAGCVYLLLDRDADAVAGVPTYNW
jgi:hypothetical protein